MSMTSVNPIILNASQIINDLAKQNSIDIDHYIDAKVAFISIAETCWPETHSHFETELRARHMNGTISANTFTILWWHLETILAYYQVCSGERKSFKEIDVSQAALLKEIECAICLTPHKKQDTLCIQSCQHEFGKACLLEWQHVSKQCPLCRSDAQTIHGYKAREKPTKNPTT
jgi:hypothetical protein